MDTHSSALRLRPAVEIFVDGPNFNLAQRFEGIPFRVDLNRLATRLSRGYHFVKLRYYTSPLPDQHTYRYRAQQRFFAQISRSSRIKLVLGRHEPRFDQETGRRYHVEKETDVNLAVDMVVGAYRDRYDVAMLVAGDSDYVRAVEALKDRGKQMVWCPLPGQRKNRPAGQAGRRHGGARHEVLAHVRAAGAVRSPDPRKKRGSRGDAEREFSATPA